MRPTEVVIVLVLLFALALPLRLRSHRPRRRRGPNAHHNADGSAKTKYRTARAARIAAGRYQHDFGDRMNAYRCSRGRHWHIGHARTH